MLFRSAMNISKKSADDALARGQGVARKTLALKARAPSVSSDDDESLNEEDAEDLKHEFNDAIALATQQFWRGKGRSFNSKKNTKSPGFAPKFRNKNCFNCGMKEHFVAECPYENREDNGGKLVRKRFSNPQNKAFTDKNGKPVKKKPSKIVLVAREDYLSGDEEEEPEKETPQVSAVAICKTATTTSLFDAPNEDLSSKGNKGICLMVKATEVTSIPEDSYTPTIDNVESLKVKLETISLDEYLSNLQGEAKRHVESLVAQLEEARDLIEVKEQLEREAADEIATLSQALTDEQELRVTIESSMDALHEEHNLNIAHLLKDRDHALAICAIQKSKREELLEAYKSLQEDLERTLKAQKALEAVVSSSSMSNEPPHVLLSNSANKDNVLSILTNPCCRHGDVLDENIKLKAELERCLASMNPSNAAEGSGTSSKAKKRKSRRKRRSSAQELVEAGTSGEGGGGTSGRGGVSAPKGGVSGRASKGFAGAHNPDYSLRIDRFGEVYAVYIGCNIDNATWTIWVPKTLCVDMREFFAEQGTPNPVT